MRNVFFRLVAVLTLVAAASTGCRGKERQPAQAPLRQEEVKANPRDEADVIPVRDRVLAQYTAEDFGAIYQEASKGFREVGEKEQFAALWKNQFEQTGAIKGFKEIGHETRPTDRFLIFTYRVQYEKMPKELRLIFGRSKEGRMELRGIHQTDNKQG